MEINKQIVYLPVKVEDDATFLITKEISDYLQANSSIDFYKDGKYIYTPAFITQTSKESEELEHLIIKRLDKQELFVFTPEQLNEYTQKVIKQALETATEKAKVVKDLGENLEGIFEYEITECYYDENDYPIYVGKESITNTFEETYNKFKV